MKPKKKFISLFFVITFSLSACMTDTILGDKIYLSEIYFLRGNGSTTDTVGDYFIYDNMKRVSLYITTFTTNINGVITKSLDTTKYFYIGSDLLPNKSIKYHKNPMTTDTIINFFLYSIEGKLVNDSLLSFIHPTNGNSDIGKRIKLFTYINNKIYIHTRNQFLNSPNNVYIQNDTLTLDVNNNIVLKHSTSNISAPSSVSISEYTYENNPSPFFNLNIWNKLGYTYEDYEFYLRQGVKNNLISSKVSVFENGVLQATQINLDNSSQYTYQSNGYPSSLSLWPVNNPNSKKLIYVYKALL